MIELRSHAGPDEEYQVGGNRLISLIKSEDNWLTLHSGAGDYWIAMADGPIWLKARLRAFSGGGGQSPHIYSAIGQIIEAGIKGEAEPILPDTTHDFKISRHDDENGMLISLQLKKNVFSLSLCDQRGNQEEKGAVARFQMSLVDCPPTIQAKLWELPYAMLTDNEQTLGNEGPQAFAPPPERPKRGWLDEAHRRYYRDLISSF